MNANVYDVVEYVALEYALASVMRQQFVILEYRRQGFHVRALFLRTFFLRCHQLRRNFTAGVALRNNHVFARSSSSTNSYSSVMERV